MPEATTSMQPVGPWNTQRGTLLYRGVTLPVKVRVRLLGVFRGLLSRSQLTLEVKRATVKGVIQAVAKSMSADARQLLVDPELDDPRPNALVLLNGKEISVLNGLETRIQDGDEITLIPVAHGG